jgi:hypothetical protein
LKESDIKNKGDCGSSVEMTHRLYRPHDTSSLHTAAVTYLEHDREIRRSQASGCTQVARDYQMTQTLASKTSDADIENDLDIN